MEKLKLKRLLTDYIMIRWISHLINLDLIVFSKDWIAPTVSQVVKTWPKSSVYIAMQHKLSCLECFISVPSDETKLTS